MREQTEWLEAYFRDNNVEENLIPRDFGGIPTYTPFGDNMWFYTRKPLSWRATGEHAGSFDDVHVPIGFVTDLTSTPKPFWSVVPRDGKYLAAAIVHDYMYWTHSHTRKIADDIFHIGMGELEVNKIIRFGVYQAVSKFGGHAWETNAEIKAAGERRVLKKFPETINVTWDQWKLNDDVFLDER